MPLPCVATHSSGDVKHIHSGIGQCLAGKSLNILIGGNGELVLSRLAANINVTVFRDYHEIRSKTAHTTSVPVLPPP